MEKNLVIVNKIGNDHYIKSINNQDYFFVSDKVKMVFDGCSSGKNSEVGVKLFSSFLSMIDKEKLEKVELFEENVKMVFEKLISISNNINFIFDNLCFTIVAVFETEENFIVKYAGDGYVIAQKDNSIEYISLEDGCENGYPKYYVYNYVEKEYLLDYKTGVKFEEKVFLKEEYQNVGVATDGLRFAFELDFSEQNKLEEFLLLGKAGKIKILINRNKIKFHDDITICF